MLLLCFVFSFPSIFTIDSHAEQEKLQAPFLSIVFCITLGQAG